MDSSLRRSCDDEMSGKPRVKQDGNYNTSKDDLVPRLAVAKNMPSSFRLFRRVVLG
jgi:hypothetical protein